MRRGLLAVALAATAVMLAAPAASAHWSNTWWPLAERVSCPGIQSTIRARPEASFEVFPTGGVAGGHAILWRGFYPANAGIWNPVTGATFRFPYPVARLRNSWSRGWGMAGDCFVSIDNLRALLSDWGECCIPVGRRKVKPLPTVA